MRIATVSLCLAGVAQAALPLTENACQCTQSCDYHPVDILEAGDKYCKVGPECSERDTDQEDKCGQGWASGALNDIVAFVSSLFSDATATAAKVEHWAKENVQDIPIDFVTSNINGWNSDVLTKLAASQWANIDYDKIKNWAQDKLDTIPVDNVHQWTSTQLDALGDKALNLAKEQFGALDAAWIQAQLESLDASFFAKLSAEQLKTLSAQAIKTIKKEQWGNIDTAAIADWVEDQVALIPLDALKDFTIDQLKDLPVDAVALLGQTQLNAIPWDKIGQLGQSQWDQIEVGKLAGLGWEQLQQAPWQRLAALSQEEWGNIPVGQLMMLAGDQIDKLDAATLGGFAQDYWNQVPMYHIVKFTAEQLQAAGVQGIVADKLALFSQAQWDAVSIDQLIALSTDQLQAIDFEALASWTQEKWNSIPVNKLVLLTGRQIKSIPAGVVANWTQEQWEKVPVHEYIMFKGSQLNDRAVLAKLSVEALARFAQTGELDYTLLEDGIKDQVVEMVLKAAGVNELADAYRLGTTLIANEASWEEAANLLRQRLLELETANATPGSESEQQMRAERVQEAKAAEVQAYNVLVESGYKEERQEEGVSNAASYATLPSSVVLIAMAIMLV